jgi:predicted ATP-binding protein involved in virulence
MRITSVTVKGLFGVFEHSIPLQSKERVTIIHGPNGFGKTVMLRMVIGLLEGDTSIFQNTPFSEFRLTFQNGAAAVVRRVMLPGPPGGKPQPSVEYLKCDPDGTFTQANNSAVPTDLPRSVLAAVDKLVPGPFRLEGSIWRGDTLDEYTLQEILALYPQAESALPPKYRSAPFADWRDQIQVFLIRANRLEAQPSRDGVSGRERFLSTQRYVVQEDPEQRSLPPRVQQHSGEVVQRIQSVLANYAKHSQERDRTFPERLVRFVQGKQTALLPGDITSRMGELEKKRKRLISLGLLDSETGLQNLSEDDVRKAPEALTIYLGDVEEKLKVFDEIADRIGSFMDIVNGRFMYKRLRIDRAQGFRVLSNFGDQAIKLEDLSSGEQQELVVLFELLFRAPKNCLLLIDEPEISLHVAWQSRFLSDLINILDLTGAYAIIATHSPAIIGNRWDLTVQLEGPAVATSGDVTA